jgi:hypothetical protein
VLSAIVRSTSSPGALAFTLAGLVPAVAEGLLSHAVVLAPAVHPDIERIADATGASLVVAAADAWPVAAKAARGGWVLLLDAGETLDDGWIMAVERHLMTQNPPDLQPAHLPLRGRFGAVSTWIDRVRRGRRIGPGLLAPRAAVVAGALPAPPAPLSAGRRGG